MELQLRNEHTLSIFYSDMDDNVSPPFEKEVNGRNFNLFSNNPLYRDISLEWTTNQTNIDA